MPSAAEAEAAEVETARGVPEGVSAASESDTRVVEAVGKRTMTKAKATGRTDTVTVTVTVTVAVAVAVT